MGLVVATTIGLCAWIIIWAVGYKAIDGFLVTVLVLVVAAGLNMLTEYLPSNRS